MRDLKYYSNLPYTEIIKPDEDGDFVAQVLEFPGCVTHGSTREEALARLQEVKDLWVQERLESGYTVPEPRPEESLPSGKWVQRVPRGLHYRLAELARKEGVSLNQLVTSILAEAVGLRKAAGSRKEIPAD